MNRVTITIHVDLPDGAVPDVAYGEVAPVVAQALRAFEAKGLWEWMQGEAKTVMGAPLTAPVLEGAVA